MGMWRMGLWAVRVAELLQCAREMPADEATWRRLGIRKGEATMLGAVHHLGYWVSDLDAAIARQDALFGAEVTRRLISDVTGGPIAFVRCGTAVVELMERAGPEGPGVLTFDHAAYEVDNLDGLVERLRGQGAEFDQPAPIPSGGRRAIWSKAATTAGIRLQLIGD